MFYVFEPDMCADGLGSDSHSSHDSNQEDYNKENVLLSINYDVASKKRKKDLLNNNSKVPCK